MDVGDNVMSVRNFCSNTFAAKIEAQGGSLYARFLFLQEIASSSTKIFMMENGSGTGMATSLNHLHFLKMLRRRKISYFKQIIFVKILKRKSFIFKAKIKVVHAYV